MRLVLKQAAVYFWIWWVVIEPVVIKIILSIRLLTERNTCLLQKDLYIISKQLRKAYRVSTDIVIAVGIHHKHVYF